MHKSRLSTRVSVEPDERESLSAYRLPDGRPLAIFQLLTHCPPALADLRGATARSLEATNMPLRQREVLILRILLRLGAEAEAQAHIALFAERAGISDSEIEDLRDPLPRGFAADDALMIQAADGIIVGGHLSDGLWSQLADRSGVSGAIETVFVGAQYLKVAVLNNALQVIPPFPHTRDARTGRAGT